MKFYVLNNGCEWTHFIRKDEVTLQLTGLRYGTVRLVATRWDTAAVIAETVQYFEDLAVNLKKANIIIHVELILDEVINDFKWLLNREGERLN